MGKRTPEERRKNTEYARQRRAKQLTAKNMKAVQCTALLMRGVPCRTTLQSRFVNGETVPFCPKCQRKADGLCIDCGAPVDGTPRRALRCAMHKKLALLESLERSRVRTKKKRSRYHRERMKDPAYRERRNEYKRLWRLAMPQRVAAAKRASRDRNPESYREYHRKYREAQRAKRLSAGASEGTSARAPRTCVRCPAVVTGRMKMCSACRQQTRIDARAQIAALHAATAAQLLERIICLDSQPEGPRNG